MIWGSATSNRDDDRRDAEDEFEAAPGEESFEPSEDAEGEPTEEIRAGETVALFGLTDSGKTSFLYALKHAPARPGRLRWSWPAASPPFAAATRSGGDALEGTRPGTFFVRPLGTLRRAWRRGPEGPRGFLACPSRRVSLPEVAGENVQMFVGGLEASDGRSQRVNDRIRDLLSTTSEVLFLVGVKESTASGTLTQDSVERSLSAAASALDRCAGFMRDPAVRPKGSPVFLTFVITKRDALRKTGLAVVRARAGESLLADILATRGGELASLLRRTEGGDVEFDVNDVCDHRDADVAVQEAAAWDFVRCHAPKAAVTLDALSRRHGVSLRVVTCKPFGCECRTPDGLSSALPLPGQIDSAMVWESLDDLVERSFRWRTRVRIQGAAVALAAAALVLTAFPLADWMARSRADAHIAARRFDSASETLDAWYVRLNPWRLFAHAVSDRHRFAEAQRWDRLRTSMEGASIDDRRLAEVEQKVAALDPSGTLVGARIRERDVALLAEFVVQGGEQPEERLESRLRGRDGLLVNHGDIETLGEEIRKAFGPAGADSSAWRKEEWDGRAKRIDSLLEWIGASPGSGQRSIVVAASGGKSVVALEGELSKVRDVAVLRAKVASIGEPAGRLDEKWIADVRADIDRAKVIKDDVSVKRLEDRRRDAVASWWRDADPRDPGTVAQLLISADGWGDTKAREACDPLARQSVRSWIDGQVAALATQADVADALATRLSGIDRALREAARALGSACPSNREALAADWKPIIDLATAVRELGKAGGIPASSASFPKPRTEEFVVEFADGADKLDIDLSVAVGKLVEQASQRLAARIPEACVKVAARDVDADRLEVIPTIAKELGVSLPAGSDAQMKLAKMVADDPIDAPGVGSAMCECLRAGVPLDDMIDAFEPKLDVPGRLAVLAAVSGCAGPGAGGDAAAGLVRRLAELVLQGDALSQDDVKRALESLKTARLQANSREIVLGAVGTRLDKAQDAARRGDAGGCTAAASAAATLVRGAGDAGVADRGELALDGGASAAQAIVKALESGKDGDPHAEQALRAFSEAVSPNGPADVPGLAAALEALKAHGESVSKWKLKPVRARDQDGKPRDAPVVVLLAEDELSFAALQAAHEEINAMPGAGALPFLVESGTVKPRKPKVDYFVKEGRACELMLARDQAQELARALGVRLATSDEWDAAYAGVEQEEDAIRDRLTEDAAPKDWATSSALRDRLQDVSGDGIVGLVLGVREWVSDEEIPRGGCTRDRLPLKEKPDPKRLANIGVRLARDPVPKELKAVADRPAVGEAAP